jgi:hypothetical protein
MKSSLETSHQELFDYEAAEISQLSDPLLLGYNQSHKQLSLENSRLSLTVPPV